MLGAEFMKWMENINGLLTNENEGQQTGLLALAADVADNGQIINADKIPISVTLATAISVVASGALLTVFDAGSSVSVTIQTHTRQASGVSTTINGGTLVGLAYSTDYYIYYDDPDGLGGTVAFVATTDATELAATGFRVSLGRITTIAASDPPLDLGSDAGLGGLVSGGWDVLPL